jgi:hypothetical protein
MMATHLTIDDGEEPVTQPTVQQQPRYGVKKDGSPRKPPGRPKVNVKPNVPDAAHAGPPLRRNNPRPPPRDPTREMAREPVRQNAVVRDREGNEIRRMRPDTGGDIFDRVRPPPGWSYQWNAVSAINKELIEIQQGIAIDMYENGWRPVPASRHPGVYTAPGYDGAIIVKGQRLEERPLALTIEAKREEDARAKAQLRDQTDSLRLTQQKLPGANSGRAKQVSGMRMTIDKSFELPPDENYDIQE